MLSTIMQDGFPQAASSLEGRKICLEIMILHNSQPSSLVPNGPPDKRKQQSKYPQWKGAHILYYRITP